MPQMFILWIQVIIRCCDYITPMESFPQAEFASPDTAASLGNSAFEQSWLDLLWSDVLGDKRWRAQEKGILRMEEITQTALSDGWERCCNSRSHWGFIAHKLRSECNQGSLQSCLKESCSSAGKDTAQWAQPTGSLHNNNNVCLQCVTPRIHHRCFALP